MLSASFARTAIYSCASLLLVFQSPSIHALTPEERDALDLSEYKVTDTDASYFDVEKRQESLQVTGNSLLLQRGEELSLGPSCRQIMSLPPITEQQRIPGFYPQKKAWELATEPLFQFEDSVSTLVGAYVASGDEYYAECLVDFLERWAKEDALTNFYYDPSQPQAWFATESMIFAAAMAYSAIRPTVEGKQEAKHEIEQWLSELSYIHLSIPGLDDNSCCNNHFYRRALYATAVGILTEDNALFRTGVSAIYSALHDMNDNGALPLEVERGRRATHYQNYAMLYLITNMELIARQGYDIYDLEIDNKTIHDSVDFTLRILQDPNELGDLAPKEQYTGFLKDDQFFGWMEVYGSRFEEPRIADFIEPLRPIYNRSSGGYLTYYFMSPDAQQDYHPAPQRKETIAFEGL